MIPSSELSTTILRPVLRALAQHEFLDFPGRRLRQRPEDDVARRLEMRQMLAAEGDDLGGGGGGTGFQGDERRRRVAPIRCGAGDARGRSPSGGGREQIPAGAWAGGRPETWGMRKRSPSIPPITAAGGAAPAVIIATLRSSGRLRAFKSMFMTTGAPHRCVTPCCSIAS